MVPGVRRDADAGFMRRRRSQVRSNVAAKQSPPDPRAQPAFALVWMCVNVGVDPDTIIFAMSAPTDTAIIQGDNDDFVVTRNGLPMSIDNIDGLDGIFRVNMGDSFSEGDEVKVVFTPSAGTIWKSLFGGANAQAFTATTIALPGSV